MKSEREYVCKGVGISFLPRQLSWPEFAVNLKKKKINKRHYCKGKKVVGLTECKVPLDLAMLC